MKRNYILSLATAALCSLTLLSSCNSDELVDEISDKTNNSDSDSKGSWVLPATAAGHDFRLKADSGAETLIQLDGSGSRATVLFSNGPTHEATCYYWPWGEWDQVNNTTPTASMDLVFAAGTAFEKEVMVELIFEESYTEVSVVTEGDHTPALNWAIQNFKLSQKNQLQVPTLK